MTKPAVVTMLRALAARWVLAPALLDDVLPSVRAVRFARARAQTMLELHAVLEALGLCGLLLLLDEWLLERPRRLVRQRPLRLFRRPTPTLQEHPVLRRHVVTGKLCHQAVGILQSLHPRFAIVVRGGRQVLKLLIVGVSADPLRQDQESTPTPQILLLGFGEHLLHLFLERSLRPSLECHLDCSHHHDQHPEHRVRRRRSRGMLHQAFRRQDEHQWQKLPMSSHRVDHFLVAQQVPPRPDLRVYHDRLVDARGALFALHIEHGVARVLHAVALDRLPRRQLQVFVSAQKCKHCAIFCCTSCISVKVTQAVAPTPLWWCSLLHTALDRCLVVVHD
mmetsp:Transcript_30722/g.55875  ORF Transcript_30722/g.55875 Transcript_30722/m.55875 type:complete len:335 (+) Transcript_30722:430-1434(+)